MNVLEKYLLTKEDAGVPSSELRHMGKQAAVRFVQNETPLNDSILEFAKESGLNLEQIKRVSEYANNDTFATMFKLGFAKNITFPMADAAAVSQSITPSKEKTASPKRPPVPDRFRYIPGQESIDLEAVFTGSGMEKTASLEKKAGIDPYVNPGTRDAARKFLDLHAENKNAVSEKEVLGDHFYIKLSALKDLCKEASRTGNSAGIIGYAIEGGGASEGLLDVIGEHVGDLAEFGHEDELKKLGMGMLMANPITGLTQELESVSGKLQMAQAAVVRTQMGMQELLAILKGPDTSPSAAQLFGAPQPPPPPGPGDVMPPQGPQPPMGAPPPAPVGPGIAGPSPMAGLQGPQGPQGPGVV